MKLDRNEQVYFNNLSRNHLFVIFILSLALIGSIIGNYVFFTTKISRSIRTLNEKVPYSAKPSGEIVCSLGIKELETSEKLSEVFSKDLRGHINKLGFKVGKTSLVRVFVEEAGEFCDVVFADKKGLRRFRITLDQSLDNLYYFQIVDIQEKRVDQKSQKLIAGDVQNYEARFK